MLGVLEKEAESLFLTNVKHFDAECFRKGGINNLIVMGLDKLNLNPNKASCFRFDLVSMFNGISKFLSYLMPKSSL